MHKCHFPDPFPALRPDSRDREFKKYQDDLLRGEIIYKWLVEGWSMRAIDLEVIHSQDYYPHIEINGYQSMGVLHHLGLHGAHQGYFSHMSIDDIIATMEVLKETIPGFDRVYGFLMGYLRHTILQEN